ncbi:MAG: hypothetical protein AVDCRST_MAG75-918, partial [uncultured Propionibacteriaceae bacterium]
LAMRVPPHREALHRKQVDTGGGAEQVPDADGGGDPTAGECEVEVIQRLGGQAHRRGPPGIALDQNLEYAPGRAGSFRRYVGTGQQHLHIVGRWLGGGDDLRRRRAFEDGTQLGDEAAMALRGRGGEGVVCDLSQPVGIGSGGAEHGPDLIDPDGVQPELTHDRHGN